MLSGWSSQDAASLAQLRRAGRLDRRLRARRKPARIQDRQWHGRQAVPLSYGTIVAREYVIPAVMDTGVATRRIRSGQAITVDGDAGSAEVCVKRNR